MAKMTSSSPTGPQARSQSCSANRRNENWCPGRPRKNSSSIFADQRIQRGKRGSHNSEHVDRRQRFFLATGFTVFFAGEWFLTTFFAVIFFAGVFFAAAFAGIFFGATFFAGAAFVTTFFTEVDFFADAFFAAVFAGTFLPAIFFTGAAAFTGTSIFFAAALAGVATTAFTGAAAFAGTAALPAFTGAG